MIIDHIAIYVENLEREKKFFEKYFGGRAGYKYHNQQTGFSSYFLCFENGARLEIMSMPESRQDENCYKMIGFVHIAFQTGSMENVKALTERLRADGFSVVSEPRITGDGYFESCVEDAEGNRIEITV